MSNKYTGARYVPKVMGDWNSAISYEPLMIVTYQGNSYTSKNYVPSGVNINNTSYWVCTGNYDAQVEIYRQDVENYKNEADIKFNEMDISLLKDTLVFSSYGTDISDINNRFESAVQYAATNKMKLYINQDIKLTRTVTLYDNAYIYSNKNKYKIYTEVGSSLNGMNLIDVYRKKNIVVHDVKFENTGYGQSGSNGIAGLFQGFGSGLNFGGCSNIDVYNCEFYKCGGYNFGEGCAMVWLSCCHYAKVHDNYFHLGDNAITVDRWYSGGVGYELTYNYGIQVYDNLIEHISGRGVVIENINDKGNIVVQNNIMTDFGVTGVEGRGFQDVIITNNIINGDLSVRVNPKNFYGLSGAGWDWGTNILTLPIYGIELISGGDRQIISNNIIKYAQSQCMFLGAYTEAILSNNKISHSGFHAVYCTAANVNANMLSLVGNQIDTCGLGVKVSAVTTYKNNNVIVASNLIDVTNQALYIEHSNIVSTSGNILNVTEGDYGAYFNDCVDLTFNDKLKSKVPATKVNAGCNVNACTNVNINGVIDTFNTALVLKTITGFNGSALLKNAINAISVDSTVAGNGRKLTFEDISGNYKTQGNDLPIVIYRDAIPTTGAGYFCTKDTMYYNTPTTFIGAVCTVAGSVGTWKTFGAVTP